MIKNHPVYFYKQYLLAALLLVCYVCTNAQAAVSNPVIDSLIVRIPAMMRSDENTARQMIARLTQVSSKENHRHGIVQSSFFRAWLVYRHGSADDAVRSIDSALNNIAGISSDTALSNFYVLKGQCFVKKTKFSDALQNFKTALAIADKRHDMYGKTGALISIGWAYMEDGKPAEAIRFFEEVLRLNPAENFASRALMLCNIASCNNAMGNYKMAEQNARKGISIARSTGNMMELANGLNILARTNYLQGKIKTAIAYLKEAGIARQKVADPSMVASDYLELADMYIKNNQPLEAIAWAKKAEVLSLKIANSLKVAAAYQTLASAYEKMGDDKMASLYFKKLVLHKDSLADDRYNQSMAEMQVQFETQKKTTENLKLKKENLEATLRNSNQQRWLLILVSGILLLAAIGIYTYYLVKSRYKTRLALEQLSEQKKRSMAVMEAEEKERSRIAADLHDGICQTLAAASLQLNKARNGDQQFEKVDELINQAGTEVRNLSHQVTPELLMHYGLEKAMAQAVDNLNDASTETKFTLFTHIEKNMEDKMMELMIYRSFQELSNNILKHAHAGLVTVQLNIVDEEVLLLVEDDGIGFETGKEGYGLGLKSMESRIAMFDGSIVIDSTEGKGTTVIIKCPFVNNTGKNI